MTHNQLAQKHLEDAITLGYITLENGLVLRLKPSEILAIAKYGLKEGLFSNDTTQAEQDTFPDELLLDDNENANT